MSRPTPETVRRGRLTLVLLVAIFALPLLGAWIAYVYFPDAIRALGTSNYGELVHPARPLALGSLSKPGGDPLDGEFLKGKWTFLYLDGPDCGPTCQRNLYKMRQVRLAQGEDYHRVQRLFVMADAEGSKDLQAVLAEDEGLNAVAGPASAIDAVAEQLRLGDDAEPVAAQRIYLVDPAGRLMMYYGPEADPSGMIEDLEHLLKVSQIG